MRTGRVLAAGLALGVIAGAAAAGPLEDGCKAMHGRDYERAVRVLGPLAKQGNAVAQFNLAVMLDEGLGLPQNYDQAFKWYRRAAEQGLVEAMYVTSYFYRQGRGRQQNTVEALKWINLAASAGLPHADAERKEQEDQMTRAAIAEGQARSLAWLARHRQPWACPKDSCPRPTWLPKPEWFSPFYWYAL